MLAVVAGDAEMVELVHVVVGDAITCLAITSKWSNNFLNGSRDNSKSTLQEVC